MYIAIFMHRDQNSAAMVKFDDEESNGRLIIPALLGLVLFVLAQVYRRRQLIASLNLPPCYSGWIPFLGCAVEFGKEPLRFIEKMRKKVNLTSLMLCKIKTNNY